jgi:hypothetical protein
MSHVPADAWGPDYRGTAPTFSAAISFAFGFLHGFFSSALAHPTIRRKQRHAQWTNQWRASVRRMILKASGPRSDAIASLRSELMGRTRSQVLLALGAPPASSSVSHMLSPHYWHADTWYYPLDVHRRLAVAISFSADRAATVETLLGPPH